MKLIGKCDILAMELLEQALEIEPDGERAALIAGAPVPIVIRRLALQLLALESDTDAGALEEEHWESNPMGSGSLNDWRPLSVVLWGALPLV